MPRRMSNRDRIARMQEEADAKAKEKKREGAAPKEPRARKGTPAPAAGRMKIVWAVCAVNGSIVRTFPYPQKASAEAEVARLNEQAPHHLRAEKVPFDD